MNPDRFRSIVAIALIATFLWPSAVRASNRFEVTTGTHLVVRLASGHEVVGTVGRVDRDGFSLQPDTGNRVYVTFRSVVVYLDPDTGKVIGFPTVTDGSLEKKIAITAAVVIGLIVFSWFARELARS
jgi:hypothetical protein